MKKLFFFAASMLIATQAFAGTAMVLKSDSGLTLIYNSADYAGDEDGPDSAISICDSEYDNCMEMDEIALEPARYKDQNSACEVTITKIETSEVIHSEKVSIVAGAASCKIKNDSGFLSISGIYNLN